MHAVKKMADVNARICSASVAKARSKEPVCSQTMRKMSTMGMMALMPSSRARRSSSCEGWVGVVGTEQGSEG
jgi:hypothetical protein